MEEMEYYDDDEIFTGWEMVELTPEKREELIKESEHQEYAVSIGFSGEESLDLGGLPIDVINIVGDKLP